MRPKIKRIFFLSLLLTQLLLSQVALAQDKPADNGVNYTYTYTGAESSIKDYLCTPTIAPAGKYLTTNPNQTWTGPSTGGQNNAASQDLYNCINRLYRFAIVVAVTASVFMLVIAGYVYMSAEGNSESVGKAKDILVSTITALVILFSGYILLRALNPDLISFANVQPPSVRIATSAYVSILGGLPGSQGTLVPQPGQPAGPGGACPQNKFSNLCGGTADSRCNAASCASFDNTIINQALQMGHIAIANANAAKLVKAIMSTESTCMYKTSPAGACGLMQLKPETANSMRSKCNIPASTAITCDWLNNPSNAVASVCLGAAYLQSLSQGTCSGSLQNIVAGYNGGAGSSSSRPGACTPSVDCANQNSCSGGKMAAWECLYADTQHASCDKGFLETRNYVPVVIGCYNQQ